MIDNINTNDDNDNNNNNNKNNNNNNNDILREFVVDSRHPGDTHACWVGVRLAVADTYLPGQPGTIPGRNMMAGTITYCPNPSKTQIVEHLGSESLKHFEEPIPLFQT